LGEIKIDHFIFERVKCKVAHFFVVLLLMPTLVPVFGCPGDVKLVDGMQAGNEAKTEDFSVKTRIGVSAEGNTFASIPNHHLTSKFFFMSLLIVEPGQESIGTSIDTATIAEMVQGFCDVTHKKLGSGAPVKVNITSDSHGVYYDKAAVLQLFNDNSGSDGLRIYLGLHKSTDRQNHAMPHRPSNYIGQHTVILVATMGKKDQLKSGTNKVAILNLTGGSGTEEGELCPPPACNGPIDAQLHP
jgi:hypothetical protein